MNFKHSNNGTNKIALLKSPCLNGISTTGKEFLETLLHESRPGSWNEKRKKYDTRLNVNRIT